MKSGMSVSATGNEFGDGFTPGTVRGVLPFVIWAAHFFLSYASVEVACARGLQLYRLAGVPTISLWLWAITALTIGALVLLTARAARNVSAESGTLAGVHLGASLMALVAVLWSVVPIAFAPLCGP